MRLEETGIGAAAHEVREGGFGAESVDVLAGCDEQGSGVMGAESEQRQRLGCRCCDEGVELCIEAGDLLAEGLDTAGDAAQCELRRPGRVIGSGRGAEP